MKKSLLLTLTAILVVGVCVLGGCNNDSTNSSELYRGAYVQAQALGYTGTLQQFVAIINGQNGVDGSDVRDGVGIASITKTSTVGFVDTYTITLTNGNSFVFTVTNGKDGNISEAEGTQGLEYHLKPDNTYAVSIGTATYMDKIVVPSTHNGLTVNEINSFSIGGSNNNLQSIQLPNTIIKLCDNAFDGCSKLASIVIPAGVTSIGNSAFNGCSSLVGIVVPNSVTTLGESVFQYCSNLTTVKLPDNLQILPKKAFIGCSKLASIIIPNSVTTIGASAFEECSSLTSIVIPDGVKSIPYCMLYCCSSLTSISIPESTTQICMYAFRYCYNLTNIEFRGLVSQWRSITREFAWNYDTGNYTIRCIDDSIAKS